MTDDVQYISRLELAGRGSDSDSDIVSSYMCVRMCVCVCVFSFFWCGQKNSLYRVPRVPEQGANAPRGYDVYAALQNRRCVCQMASVRIVYFPIHPSIHQLSNATHAYISV